MAQDTLVRLAGPIALPLGDTTVITVAAGHTYTIRDITITNTSGIAVSVSVGINGLASAQLLLPVSSIDAGGFATFSGVLILHDNETLQVATDHTGLNITISGMDQEL